MNVAANLLHPAQPTRHTQAPRFCMDAFSRLTHKESPHEFRHEFKDNIELEHGVDGGAVRTKSKDGKTGPLALTWQECQIFPSFQVCRNLLCSPAYAKAA